MFLNGIRKPYGALGADTAYEGYDAIAEAVANCDPPFIKLVMMWTQHQYDHNWLADELAHAQLKNTTLPAGGFDANVIRLGMQACEELIDLLNIEFEEQ